MKEVFYGPPLGRYLRYERSPLPAVEVQYHCFPDDLVNCSKEAVELFVHVIQTDCVSTLRTKETLGYLVSCGRTCDGRKISIKVFSDGDPCHIGERIIAFVNNLDFYLSGLEENDVQKHIAVLLKREEIEPSSLAA